MRLVHVLALVTVLASPSRVTAQIMQSRVDIGTTGSMVVVLKNGQRYTFPLSDVARIEFDGTGSSMPSPAPTAPAASPTPAPSTNSAGSFATRLTSGAVLHGQSRTSSSKAWDFNIKITSYDSRTGALSGEIDWIGLGSVHRIQGSLVGGALTFREVSAIRSGAANLNVSYEFTVDANGANGSWYDPSYNPPRGSAVIYNR